MIRITRRKVVFGLIALPIGIRVSAAEQNDATDLSAGVAALRLLNTALLWHKIQNGKYSTLSTVVQSDAYRKLAKAPDAFGLTADKVKAFDFSKADFTNGWKIKFALSGDSSGYLIVVGHKAAGGTHFC
jgi:hypothetical protein